MAFRHVGACVQARFSFNGLPKTIASRPILHAQKKGPDIRRGCRGLIYTTKNSLLDKMLYGQYPVLLTECAIDKIGTNGLSLHREADAEACYDAEEHGGHGYNLKYFHCFLLCLVCYPLCVVGRELVAAY